MLQVHCDRSTEKVGHPAGIWNPESISPLCFASSAKHTMEKRREKALDSNRDLCDVPVQDKRRVRAVKVLGGSIGHHVRVGNPKHTDEETQNLRASIEPPTENMSSVFRVSEAV